MGIVVMRVELTGCVSGAHVSCCCCLYCFVCVMAAASLQHTLCASSRPLQLTFVGLQMAVCTPVPCVCFGGYVAQGAAVGGMAGSTACG